MSARWITLMETSRLRWGGDLRRYHLLRELARITRGHRENGWSPESVNRALAAVSGRAGYKTILGRPNLVSAELLSEEALAAARGRASLVAVDLHDEPVAHLIALGFEPDEARASQLRARVDSNLAAFRRVIAQTPEFARLVGLPASSTIIAPSGTDSDAIRPGPWSDIPTVTLVTGASPARGIEPLIDACRSLRASEPRLRLRLILAATGEESMRYVERLRGAILDDGWINADGPVPYAEIGPVLAESRVMVIAQPASPYWDAVLPIKLFDYLASGHPIVTTPRAATAELITRHGAGLVAAGDAPEDLAAAIERLLGDEPMARRMGAAGRRAAESVYDWRVVGRRLADDLIREQDRLLWLRRRIAVARRRAS